MKKQLFSFACAASICIFAACNSDVKTETTTTTDSSAAVTTTDATTDAYVDLSTGQPVVLDVDATTYVAKPREQGVTVKYYVNRNTSDTIEAATGRILNGALMLDNGTWMVDENKVKLKTDEEGDTKFKSDDLKVKDKDGKYKEKTDTSKLKIKDGKTKVKTDGSN